MKIEKINIPEQAVQSAASVKKQIAKDKNQHSEDAVSFDSNKRRNNKQQQQESNEQKEDSGEELEARNPAQKTGLNVVV